MVGFGFEIKLYMVFSFHRNSKTSNVITHKCGKTKHKNKTGSTNC